MSRQVSLSCTYLDLDVIGLSLYMPLNHISATVCLWMSLYFSWLTTFLLWPICNCSHFVQITALNIVNSCLNYAFIELKFHFVIEQFHIAKNWHIRNCSSCLVVSMPSITRLIFPESLTIDRLRDTKISMSGAIIYCLAPIIFLSFPDNMPRKNVQTVVLQQFRLHFSFYSESKLLFFEVLTTMISQISCLVT